MPAPSPEIADSGSPGSTRMAMKMSSVTPKSVGMAMRRRWARYLRMKLLRRLPSSPRETSPLSIQPEGVHATELREDASFAVVAPHGVAPHRQMVGEPDEVERRRLVQEHHALREELLALALVRLAVDLLQQLVELRIGVPGEVQRAAGLQAHLPARPGISDGRAVLRLHHHVEGALLQLLDEERPLHHADLGLDAERAPQLVLEGGGEDLGVGRDRGRYEIDVLDTVGQAGGGHQLLRLG